MPDIQGLEHIATMLVAQNLDETVTFYVDKLGFSVVTFEPHIALLEHKDTRLYFITESPPTPDKPSITLKNTNTPGSTGALLIFRVEDCRATYDDLVQRGLVFLTPPQSPPWGGWRCFALDLNGYVLEFEQPGE
jgi:catechol 2,3-dioxygenase-like lactoylglutathione lyase family enzyme